VDIAGNMFDVIGETTKIQTLLQQYNHEELCNSDLIENEEFLIILSTLNIRARFNPRTIYLIDIIINSVVS